MGIHGLTKFLLQKAPSAVEQKAADAFMGQVVAIDASTSLYAFMIAIRDSENFSNLTNSAGESTSHLAGMLSRAVRILELGMKPIYVFDGKAPTMKSGELAKRRDKKAAAEAEMVEAKERGDNERVRQLAGRTVRVGRRENDDVKKLLRLMGIPIIEAPGEAECQCAFLCRAKIADAVVSEDADSLCFGASKLIRGLTFSDKNKNQVTLISLEKIHQDLQLTHEEFIQFCILCGCDYSATLRGIGPLTAFKFISKYRSIKNMFQSNHIDPKTFQQDPTAAVLPTTGTRRKSLTTREEVDDASSQEKIEQFADAGVKKENSGELNEADDEISGGHLASHELGDATQHSQQPAGAVEEGAGGGGGSNVVLDGKLIQVPKEFPYEEAYELFVNPSVISGEDLKAINLEPGELQEKELWEFLVTENQFNETRITNAITRLKAAKRLGAQTRLDTFFRAQPPAKRPTPTAAVEKKTVGGAAARGKKKARKA